MRALFIVCVLTAALIACDHKERVDENPAADAWTELSTSMNAQVTALRERQRALTARITALAMPTGTEDVTLAAAIGELQAAVGPLDATIGKAEAAAAQVTAEVNAALGGKDKRAAARAVDAGRTAFTDASAGAEPALSTLEPKIAAAEQIVQRLTAGTEAELMQLRRLAAAGGSVDFSAIDFKVGTAELDFTHAASKATLDRLVQFASACPQLRFGITGHTSKEGAAARNRELSLARAEAIKAYLVAQAVEPAKIVRTAGLGSTKPLADEPDPGTPAEAAMDPATLESVRRKNRRISVDVVTSCAVAAAPPTEPPPAQPPSAEVAPPSRQPPSPPTAAVRPGGAPRTATPSPH